jgi:flavin reductase (DIM6/NTAB) family NADH-FMN oxidoreductase RutF
MTQSSTAANASEIVTDTIPGALTSGSRGQQPPANAPDCRDFRNTLGRFATGVTVITALSSAGTPVGLTISSFNSVSLDPPLILWSLSLNSPSLDSFRTASHYAVNVLSTGQQEISNRFASRVGNRFADLPCRPGLGGAPLLEGCCAWFECAPEAVYPGGDHLILVGRVERFSTGTAEAPLIFHNARYHRLQSAVT